MFSLKQSVIAALALSIGMVNALTGDATWYTPNGGVGACGVPLQNSGHIVALSSDQYAGGAHCWKHIGVNYNGKFVDATIGDLCPGCSPNRIDLLLSAFQVLAPLSVGCMQVNWNYE
ncbi:riboflavine-aldehyde-forming enzyme [Armillaria novae-zelandiae]|uniref:Riboflavine-aldehyde-forming enzyme n=1 Tax=Armillaria novae-zelandiae TaxID=153914 RepID=A0AA39PSJ8_9AGAR|nr:riboflavine-aldehyde-forming enzyme [Armillaria novae-zelandiae]